MSRRGCCSLSAASKCAVPAELKLSLCCEVWQEVLIKARRVMRAVIFILCQQRTFKCCARTAKAHPYTAWPCRRFMFGPGTLTGATDFVLRQQRTFRVAAYEGKVRALCMHRSDFEALSDKDPEVRHRIDTSEHDCVGVPKASK